MKKKKLEFEDRMFVRRFRHFRKYLTLKEQSVVLDYVYSNRLEAAKLVLTDILYREGVIK